MPIYTYIYNDTPQTGKWCKKKKPSFWCHINKICVNNAQYTGMCVSLDDWRL